MNYLEEEREGILNTFSKRFKDIQKNIDLEEEYMNELLDSKSKSKLKKKVKKSKKLKKLK